MIEQDPALKKIASNLPYPLHEYNMSSENQSSFLDIGSGFGKPVFHSAMQTGCPSYGIEVCPSRYAFSESKKWDFKEFYDKFERKSPNKNPPETTKMNVY